MDLTPQAVKVVRLGWDIQFTICMFLDLHVLILRHARKKVWILVDLHPDHRIRVATAVRVIHRNTTMMMMKPGWMGSDVRSLTGGNAWPLCVLTIGTSWASTVTHTKRWV